MTEDDTAAQDRAAKAQKALDRAADGAKAMAEYEAEKRATDANTARLRALRLEKERLEREAAKAAAKPKASGRKARASVPA
ncbi:MAG: hypothetical protein JWQ36_1393 [Enterovirga sp.]|jgi:hypothetical protein|nr:hypothetical protein [Enterovirga sp.]